MTPFIREVRHQAFTASYKNIVKDGRITPLHIIIRTTTAALTASESSTLNATVLSSLLRESRNLDGRSYSSSKLTVTRAVTLI